MASINNLTIYQGATSAYNLTVAYSTGTAFDLTGATVYFMAKSNYSDADGSAVISKSVSSHDDAENGLTSITINPADTSGLRGVYKYDIQLNTSGGAIYIISAGTLTILEKVKD